MADTRAGSFASQQIGPGARAPGLFDIVLISCLFVCLFVVLLCICALLLTLARAPSAGGMSRPRLA